MLNTWETGSGLTCLKQSMVMAAQATMTAMATVKTAWRTLSRVEHVGNRKWPHLFEAEYSDGSTRHHDGNGDCEDGMEDLVTC